MSSNIELPEISGGEMRLTTGAHPTSEATATIPSSFVITHRYRVREQRVGSRRIRAGLRRKMLHRADHVVARFGGRGAGGESVSQVSVSAPREVRARKRADVIADEKHGDHVVARFGAGTSLAAVGGPSLPGCLRVGRSCGPRAAETPGPPPYLTAPSPRSSPYPPW